METLLITLGSLALTAIGFFWKVELKIRKGNTQLLVKGVAAMILIFAMAATAFIQTGNQQKTEKSRDSLQVVINQNTDKTAHRVFIGFSKVNSQLDSLIEKTSESTVKAKAILKVNDKLYQEIDRLNKLQLTTLKANGPIIAIYDSVNWKKSPFGNWLIKTKFRNVGKRSAKDLDYCAVFIPSRTMPDKTRVSNSITVVSNATGGIELSPLSEQNAFYQIEFDNIPKLNKIDSLQTGFILIYYTYTDFGTGDTFKGHNLYSWDSYKKSGYKFVDANASEKTAITESIKKSKFKLPLPNGKVFVLD